MNCSNTGLISNKAVFILSKKIWRLRGLGTVNFDITKFTLSTFFMLSFQITTFTSLNMQMN